MRHGLESRRQVALQPAANPARVRQQRIKLGLSVYGGPAAAADDRREAKKTSSCTAQKVAHLC
jgi:hypothetical protein